MPSAVFDGGAVGVKHDSSELGSGHSGRGVWMSGTKVRVRTAVLKKIAVLVRERGERRGRPQSMWPEVQPEEN